MENLSISENYCTGVAKGRMNLVSLPYELQQAILSVIARPTDLINLVWSSRALYERFGPSNKLLWYHTRFSWIRKFKDMGQIVSEVPPPQFSDAPLQRYIPPFDGTKDYYQECLDILCGRYPQESCQVCFWSQGPDNRAYWIQKFVQWGQRHRSSRQEKQLILASEGDEKNLIEYGYTFTHMFIVSLFVGEIFWKMACPPCIQDIAVTAEPQRYAHQRLPPHPNSLIRFADPTKGHGNLWERTLRVSMDYSITRATYEYRLSDPESRMPDSDGSSERDQFFGRAAAKMNFTMELLNSIDSAICIMLEELQRYPPAIQRVFGVDSLRTELYTAWNKNGQYVSECIVRNGESRLFHSIHGTLLRRLGKVTREHIEMKDLVPRKREDITKMACRKELCDYFGSPQPQDYVIDEAGLRDNRGIYNSCQQFFLARVSGGPAKSHWNIDILPNHIRGAVCEFCQPEERVDLISGRTLVHEDVRFILHVLESHPERMNESWEESLFGLEIHKLIKEVMGDDDALRRDANMSRFVLAKPPIRQTLEDI